MTTGLQIEVSRSETVSIVALWGELDLSVIAGLHDYFPVLSELDELASERLAPG